MTLRLRVASTTSLPARFAGAFERYAVRWVIAGLPIEKQKDEIVRTEEPWNPATPPIRPW